MVHSVFYNFADGEVARHIPWVWGKVTPEETIAVRERGSADAMRQPIGELAASPGLVRAADLATRAAVSAPMELTFGERPEEFGRLHHLPKTQIAAAVDGLRARGLADDDSGFTDAGREFRQRIEALTDEPAAPAYEVLSADELDELIVALEPIVAVM